jgi:hypothetical protein
MATTEPPKHAQRQRQAAATMKKIARMIRDGYTYEQIGRALDPPVTKSSVMRWVKIMREAEK